MLYRNKSEYFKQRKTASASKKSFAGTLTKTIQINNLYEVGVVFHFSFSFFIKKKSLFEIRYCNNSTHYKLHINQQQKKLFTYIFNIHYFS